MARADAATKNIWVAAGDGDLERVKELVEQQGLSPNEPDEVIGYTPMHAAASYGRFEVLTYLIKRGGDVNITDEEGDTPLYTAESVPVAQFLVEHGALVDVKNSDNISPAEAVEDDFPVVAAYIRSQIPLPAPAPDPHGAEVVQDAASEEPTLALSAETKEIMVHAEQEDQDPHDELTREVGGTVPGGIAWAAQQEQDQEPKDADTVER